MDMGGHDMGGMGGAAPPSRMRYTHMTFFWGKNSEILFDGWPGTRGGMYALALVAVFALTVLVEYLGCCRWPERYLSSRDRRAAAAVARAAVHAARMGVAYLLMLAIMSFNVGVLLVAVAGHATGFLAFRARAPQVENGGGKAGDPTPEPCC